MEFFPKFPKNFLAGLFPFLLTALILLSAKYTKLWPNPVIFYTVVGLTCLIILGVVGWKAIIETLGFDVTMPGELLEKVWFRYPLLIAIGLFVGYGTFRLTKYLTMTFEIPFILFPMDFALATYLIKVPLYLTALNWLIVASGEEIMRNSTIFIFANWLGRFGIRRETAISLGILISTFFFIGLHTLVNPEYVFPITFLVMFCIAALFSCLGYSLAFKNLGPLAFFEFSIIPCIAAHFLWNYLIDIELRVLPFLWFLV